jgi:hypothetical protein
MDIGDKQRLEKLVGMLGSDQMGERASAAAFIAKMAREQTLTIVELMRRAFGSTMQPQAKPQQQQRNPYTDPFFTDPHEAMRQHQAAMEAERVRRHAAAEQEQERQRAARARNREAMKEEIRRKHPGFAPAHEFRDGPGFGAASALLDQLRAVKLSGRLNPWECQFANDVCDRYQYDAQLSERQMAVIRKILAKTGA